ncbi:MAG: Rnd: ribonuclease, partial [Phycisphaerales bacterium]|nr:Rnd: ribonuclease [Phycisphaerales bacterium]
GPAAPEPTPGAAHPLVPRGPAALVTTDADLAALIGRLRAAGVFAYDSEFIGELSYHPKLCLIQVASAAEVALIDPLADLDLTPFWELLADPAVAVIVHAGSQDVEPVVRHLGRGPTNVFDTQIAAGLAGFPYPVSLSKLALELTGAKLGKGLTFTHWDQRPLSSQQLRYAADDVRYLPRLHAELKAMLESSGHLPWAVEECDAMCRPHLYKFDPDVQWLRIKGAGSLDAKHAGVLRQLVIWRNEAAKHEDVPPRAFLKDEILIDLSRSPIRSVDQLDRVKGRPRPVEIEHGRAIVELTARGLTDPPANLPDAGFLEPSPTDRYNGDALLAAAQVIGFAKGIDPALVGSRADFTDLYYRLRDGANPDGLRVTTGWRRAAIGDDVIALYKGEKMFGFRWSDGLTAVSIRPTAERARQ